MISADPGSFRDPASRIYIDGDRVIRALDTRGLEAWKNLSASSFHQKAVTEGLVISSEQISEVPNGAAGALEHPRLPFISYPYEWTFSMLKDAALLQLRLLEMALTDSMTIKDATPFNIQFVSGKPMFIDVGSFEAYRPGEPWIGYRQFTRQFLFPLMLRAWVGVPFQPWLRGHMKGPTAHDMKKLLSKGRLLTPGARMHVSMQARMEAKMSGIAVRQNLSDAGFTADLILANVRRLAKLVRSLEWQPDGTEWVDYQSCAHVGRDRETKADFLRGALGRSRARRVLDLGANDGYFSDIVVDEGAHAIAVDGDESVLESVYQRSSGKNVSIVVSDISNPSPSQGWVGTERSSLLDRANPDLVIAYGLIHHLIYTSSIPPTSVLDWLRAFHCDVVVEFVSPDDEMVLKLTANKLEGELHRDRTEAEFRSLIENRFDIRAEHTLDSRTRVLFELTPANP